MRDDLVLADVAQRLRGAGLAWRPQPGDWCALVGAAHVAGAEAGLWLVIDAEASRWLKVVDGAAQWAARRIIADEALWLPTTGQLKGLLRAIGYNVSTLEGMDLPDASPTAAGGNNPAWAASLLPTTAPLPATPSPLRHYCRATRTGRPPIEARALSEAEALAQVVLAALIAAPPPRH
jgi:hypothetical protein